MEESKELQLLQEWAPFTYITEQIKREVRIGFSSMKQHLTCIDFTDTHISVGSDCGVIYWCPRSGLKPRELRLQVTFVLSNISHLLYFVYRIRSLAILRNLKQHFNYSRIIERRELACM